ncbi:MAG: molybdate ABC transporter substrate-binding protein, partial [Chlorobiales bacterium]|nr:molybdate ABC transporter substrate-binding protein [Chlorobiales bacterium]
LKKAGMGWTGFPDDAYNPAGLRQAMVLLDSTNRAAAVFFRFMMSEEAGNILKIKGYRVE